MHLTSVTVASVLAVALLPAVMLADAKEDYRHNPIVREGAIALFQSARYGSYLAVYLDQGAYRFHENRGLVRRAGSCFGGDFAVCEDAANCADLEGVEIMAPPPAQSEWRRGPTTCASCPATRRPATPSLPPHATTSATPIPTATAPPAA